MGSCPEAAAALASAKSSMVYVLARAPACAASAPGISPCHRRFGV